jgi:hypothetical protein
MKVKVLWVGVTKEVGAGDVEVGAADVEVGG